MMNYISEETEEEEVAGPGRKRLSATLEELWREAQHPWNRVFNPSSRSRLAIRHDRKVLLRCSSLGVW